MKWSKKERAGLVEILLNYVNDKSSMVRTFSMQALADLAVQDISLRPGVLAMLAELIKTGSPAMKSRGRKLLERLKRL